MPGIRACPADTIASRGPDPPGLGYTGKRLKMMDACISPEARIGKNVEIGFGTRIYGCVEIGDDTRIGDLCVIGLPVSGSAAPTAIGPGSIIRSHGVIYQDAQLGAYFQSGHHTLVREGTRAGINLRVGSFSDLEGACSIGDYCRFHSYVHVGRGSRIGHFVWLFSLTTLTNDPLPPSHVERPVTVEDGVVVCVGSIVLPGTVLRQGAFVSAGSRARGEVPPGAVVDGHRGDVIAHVSQLASMEDGVAHPWMGHFADAYPEAAWPRIEALRKGILAAQRRVI